ncbi:hypothetical protein KJ039_07295 [bacterium]|nr:hypothetical protein [bacterium]
MGAQNLGLFTLNASDSQVELGYCQLNLTNALNKRLYRDMGAGYFGGNFTHLVRARIGASGKMFVPWMLSNLSNGSYAAHLVENSGSTTLSLRSDTHTVNGQLGYKLQEVNSSSLSSLMGSNVTTGPVHWDSDVYIRHSDGSETQIGFGVARVTRSEGGEGFQSGTWSVAERELASGDAIKVVEKIYDNTTLKGTRTFISDAFGSATTLRASTWTFQRYTYWDDLEELDVRLSHGNATYNSRIEGIKTGPHPGFVNPFLAVRMDSTDGNKIILEETTSSGDIATDTYTCEQGKIYYLEIERDEAVGTYGTLYCRIYDDEARTNLVDTLSLTLRAAQDLRYVYALNTYESGTSATGMAMGLSLDGSESYGAGVVANTSYEFALAFPPQQSVFYDGMQHCVIFTSTGPGSARIAPSIAYGLDSDLLFGLPNIMPGLGKAIGRLTSSFYSYSAYAAWVSVVTDPSGTPNYNIRALAEDNDSNSTTLNLAGAAITDVVQNPSVLIDADNRAWIAGMTSTGTGGNIVVKKASETYFRLTNWESPTTMGAVTSGQGASTQLIYYQNGDIGCLWADGGAKTLYYKHYTKATDSWSGADTVASSLWHYYSFRGVTTRDGKLFVLYREGNSNKLRYVIRTSGWSSPVTVNDDTELNAGIGFTICADVGKPNAVYIIYRDTNTDIVYRVWDGTNIGGKTTLVEAPSLMGTSSVFYLHAPFYECERIPVVYHLSNGDIKVSVIEVSAVQPSGGTGGTLVSTRGDTRDAIDITGGEHMVTAGTRSFILFYGRDHQGYARLYDHQAQDWTGAAALATRKRYWDHHNSVKVFLDTSKYVYIFEGARTIFASVDHIKIRKSDYPLDHASFTLDFENDWTDISPPEDSSTTGRGYKGLVVDQAGVIHLVTMTNTLNMIIREYRSGAWSTPQTIVTITNHGAPYNTFLYWTGVKLGRETSGQKSILVGWSIKHHEQPETSTGNNLNIEISFLRLLPQGDGTYKAYRADGVEMSLPCGDLNKDMIISAEEFSARQNSTSYSVNDIVVPNPANGHCYRCKIAGTSGGAAPTWPTDHFATVEDGTVTWEEWGLHTNTQWLRVNFWDSDSLDASTPCGILGLCDKTAPYDINELDFFKWTGSAWSLYAIDSSTPFPDDLFNKMVIGGEGIFVTGIKAFSGMNEVVTYNSTDGGETWTEPNRLTTSSYPNQWPILSPRTSQVQNLIWSQRIHLAYSEVYFGEVQITVTRPASYYFTLMQGGL